MRVGSQVCLLRNFDLIAAIARKLIDARSKFFLTLEFISVIHCSNLEIALIPLPRDDFIVTRILVEVSGGITTSWNQSFFVSDRFRVNMTLWHVSRYHSWLLVLRRRLRIARIILLRTRGVPPVRF